MYDGASQPSIDGYNQTLPKVTTAALQPIMDRVAAWYLTTTFGVRKLNITVLPAVELGKATSCGWQNMYSDAYAAIGGRKPVPDVVVGVTPYTCWSSQASTGGEFVAVWGTVPDGAGLYAHEIGHALWMLHNASKYNGNYVEYGSDVDQMGRGSDFFTLTGFASPHLVALGALTPKPCASATLRTITAYPDAIQCGQWMVDFQGDWRNEIRVHKQETFGSNYGGSDTTDYARLPTGQSYTTTDGTNKTFTNNGNGSVTVK
jgi:hypothetical protein